MRHRTERPSRRPQPPRTARSMPVRRWSSAACVLALLIAAPSATAAAGQGGTVRPGLGHNPAVVEQSTATIDKNSPSWAGFAGTGATFSDVVGSWVQPAVTCPTNQQQDAAFWVGIDGYQSNTVEQTGTDSDCNKGNKKHPGGAHYYAWWQMYPGSSNVIAHPVGPLDSMTAEVSTNGSTFTLTLTDNTQGWTNSTTQTPTTTAAAASAEWIVEAPTIKGKPSKLANFGSVSFSGLSVTSNPSSFTPVQFTMTKGKKVKASPTKMSGASFTVNWEQN